VLSNDAERIIKEYCEGSGDRRAIIICGPTASGKTSVSLEVADKLGGEIVSCDSMQIYRYMDIGTAKATAEEKKVAPHHMIDIVMPWESYSVFQYKEAAEKCIDDILSRGKVPIITGGTGLYVNTLVDNRQYVVPDDPYDVEALEKARALYENCAHDKLYNLLCDVDPGAADNIHSNNVKRVFRAVELFYITGKTQEVRNAESVALPGDIEYKIYCKNPERDILYERINKRVDLMISQGLLDEVRMVYNMCRENTASIEELEGLTSLQAIGYKELIPYIDSDVDTLNIAVDAVKQNSRRYAKRQLTWFKKTPGVIFINGDA